MSEATERRSLWHEPPSDDPRTWPIDRLAYIGDAVFELYVRMAVAGRSRQATGALHGMSVRLVSAAAQTAACARISDMLSEDEAALLKRGRNAKPHSLPKHAEQSVYRQATGFEALLGYLYLSGQDERLAAVCRRALEVDEHD